MKSPEEDAAAMARALHAEYTVCGQAPMQETACVFEGKMYSEQRRKSLAMRLERVQVGSDWARLCRAARSSLTTRRCHPRALCR